MMRPLLAALALSLALPALGAAQTPESQLVVGQRVKIRTAARPVAVGVLTLTTPDSLVLLTEHDAARLAVPRSEITKLYISEGRSAWAGAVRGMMWGGGFGAAAAFVISADPCPNSSADTCTRGASSSAPSRGRVAAEVFFNCLAFGAGIGALVKAETWRELPLQPKVTLTPLSVRLSLAFGR